MNHEKNSPRPTTMLDVVVLLGILVACLAYGLVVAKVEVHPLLFVAGMMIAAYTVFVMKYRWEVLESAIFDSIRSLSVAMILLYIIGMVIATWILSGVVPAMIYYGLQLIHPQYFLATAMLLCACVSVPTGSSWTTAGTVGVALVGIGEGLGVPLYMTGGAVISGAYFGDKLSPLSDTSNLCCAIVGSNLIEHIKHMLKTSIPVFIIALIGYFILGFNLPGGAAQTDTITTMLEVLQANYNISPWLLLVPVIVIGIVMMKVPAIPGLFCGALLGGVAALFAQEGITMSEIIGAMHYGTSVDTGNAMIDNLLSRGGLAGMANTIALIMGVSFVSGIFEVTKVTTLLTEAIIKLVHGVGSLVGATVFTGFLLNFLVPDQYVAILMDSQMFKETYAKYNLASKNLSRAVQDSATITSVFVPWNTCGAYFIATLGLANWTYIPYSFFNILMPIFSIFVAYIGWTMTTIDQEKAEQEKLSLAK